MFTRRAFVGCTAGTIGALAAAPVVQEKVKSRPPLAPAAFYRLPLGSVKPGGWLKDQLRIQAEGLSGHLGDFWPDTGPNSAWLGGTGEGWERGPYYLDGLLPLAYLLAEPRLIAKVKPWVDWTLDHQRPDGSIGPEKNRDWWPIMIMLKVLTQYHEASGDPRVIPVMQRFFAYQSRMLANEPLKSWAVYRWQDELASLLWLYDRTGDAQLLELSRQLKSQGFDWRKFYENFPYNGRIARGQSKHENHGVNNAMGLKTAALWYLVSHDPADRAGTAMMLATLDRFEGLPNGMFSADEHFAGRNPSQGIELCAVVETMFSLELALAVLGDARLADRLERIAFNPLPGAQTADQWSHQYDQQPNQVMVSFGRRDWTTNGPESNLFGLEPNYGCCTANLHQGWPKFTASLWMSSADGGLVAAAYAPSEVLTKINGVAVAIHEETDYPFREDISLTISPATPLSFPLYVRIPQWTSDPVVVAGGEPIKGLQPGTYHRIEREWRRGDRVEITLPMPVRTIPGYNGSVSVERGPLIFSLRIGEAWNKLKQTGPVTDWEVYPTSPWNYGLSIDTNRPAASFQVRQQPVARQPFDRNAPPVLLEAKGARLPDWVIEDNSAAPPPQSPATGKAQLESITLIPYGAARLRVTSFPVLGAAPPTDKKG